MNEETPRLLLLLIGPGTLAIFGLGFLWAWSLERKRHYLLLLSAGCISFSLGALIQIFRLPEDIGVNAVLSNVFYTSAVVMVCDGILRRSSMRFGLLNAVLFLLLLNYLIWHFYYVDRDLVMRIYIQNFGIGLILLVTALRLRGLIRGRFIDKALFWTILIFSLQFFPRTILTIGTYEPGNISLFGESLFWRMLQLSNAVLGAGFALVTLAAAITDVIDDLRHERDIDHLTGVLNRRSFEEQTDHLFAISQGLMIMIVCDIDYFKKINDHYGHTRGDEVLAIMGSILRRTVRKGDLVGRLGGEEFAILLPNSNLREAQVLTERLHTEITTAVYPIPSDAHSVTVSIGVALSGGAEKRKSLFERADLALYEAKATGRNRTVFSADPSLGSGLAETQIREQLSLR